MGLSTGTIDSASSAVKNLAEKGITINVDSTTIQSIGVYLIVTGIVTGFTVAFFSFIFRRFLG